MYRKKLRIGFSRRKPIPIINSTLMKLSLAIPLFMAATLQVGAVTIGQTITLKKKNLKIEQLLKEVKKQTGYNVFFNESVVPVNKRLEVSYEQTKLSTVLDDLSSKYRLNYTIVDNNIVLSSAHEAAGKTSDVAQQQLHATGRVSNAKGEALSGVTVAEIGSTNTVISNSNGEYSIHLRSSESTLRFSFLGYASKDVKPTGTVQNIQLEETVNELADIVVVGYGTQKRDNLTAAASIVDPALLKSRPGGNASSLLQGTVPNMQVKFSTGRPGASGSFNIRGVNSISSTASPLVIIDGFEGDINRINPNDIESVTVLKDASAAAVYGARASYGVIIVTTKSGNAGTTNISYSGQASISSPTTSTDYETRGYYSAGINDKFFSQYAGTSYTRYTDDDYYQLWLRRDDKTEHPDRPWVVVDNRDGRESYVYYGNTDWYSYLFDDKRPMQSHDISVVGAKEGIKYSLSGNYYDQKGMFRHNPDQIKKYNLRSKVDFQVKPWLDINTNLSYFNSAYSYPGRGGVENTFNSSVSHGLASIVPQNPDGTLVYATTISNYNVMDGYSAMLTQGLHHNMDKISEFSPTIEAVLKPLKGLELRSSYRFIHYNYQTLNRSVNIPYSKYPGEVLDITTGIGSNRLSEAQINHYFQGLNTYATYEHNLQSGHNFKLMGGMNYETRYIKDLKAARDGLLSNQLTDFELATGDVLEVNGGQNEYALFGVFYRANYSFKERYLVEAAGRYDGTSRFAKGQRYGFFPSFSAGWRLDREDFFQDWDQSVLSSFKLRASYGSLGNQQVGYYDYLQKINAGGVLKYSFGDGTVAPFANETAPNSSGLTWETVNTTNIGVDMELFKSKLSFAGDIYWRETLNMLTAGKTIPSYYGAAIPRENASDLLTKGWEVSLRWKDNFDLAAAPFAYYVGVGVGDNISKITRFDNPNKNLGNFYEGQTLGQIWGYEVNGYFKTDDEAKNYDVDQKSVNTIINSSALDQGLRAGDLKFEDLDGDKVISMGDNTLANSGDRRVIGNSLPRYNFNFNTGGSWKGIDLSVFFQGIGRQHWYPGAEASNFWGPYGRPYATFIPQDFLSQVWSEENPDAYFPRPRGYVAINNTNRSLGVASTKYLQNLMYIRLKNLTVGYSLPASTVGKIGLTRLRFYLSGENIWTYTKLKSKYIDPEQAATLNTYNVSTSTAKTYPWAKTFMFGLDIGL